MHGTGGWVAWGWGGVVVQEGAAVHHHMPQPQPILCMYNRHNAANLPRSPHPPPPTCMQAREARERHEPLWQRGQQVGGQVQGGQAAQQAQVLTHL